VATLALFDPTPEAPAFAGRALGVRLGERVARVAIYEECGKIDLNTGWATLIQGLFDRMGAPQVAQAVLDWRDPDQRPRPGGAEDADYRSAGISHGARDGPLETIEELLQVLGMSVPLYVDLAPHVTVDCQNAGIDPLVASEQALAAVPNLIAGSLPAYLSERADYLAGRSGAPAQLLGGEPFLEPSTATAFSLIVALDGPVRHRWEAVVVLSGDAARPYLIRAWRRPVAGSD
jgi:general secretion pathway protein K